MKKILLFVIPLLALSLFSCNKKTDYPTMTVGSLEQGVMGSNYFVTYEGIRLTASQGTSLPNLPEGLNRMWVRLDYYMDEAENANTVADSKKIKVDEVYQLYGFNQRPVQLNSFEDDDPIQSFPAKDQNGNDISAISTRQNYMFMLINHHYFVTNKSDRGFSEFDFAIEFDPELVVAQAENEPDTINLRLKFNANRANNEKLYDSQRTSSSLALDLTDLSGYFGLEMDEDFAYILKLNYYSYDYESSSTSTDEDKKSYKYRLVKWTPNDPYKEIPCEK